MAYELLKFMNERWCLAQSFVASMSEEDIPIKPDKKRQRRRTKDN